MNDTIEFLGGKWKIPILCALDMGGKQRFGELQRNVKGITPKMLSKELQDMEMNRLVSRRVIDSKPVSVEYELTPYAENLRPMISAMLEWGMQHRRFLMGGER